MSDENALEGDRLRSIARRVRRELSAKWVGAYETVRDDLMTPPRLVTKLRTTIKYVRIDGTAVQKPLRADDASDRDRATAVGAPWREVRISETGRRNRLRAEPPDRMS